MSDCKNKKCGCQDTMLTSPAPCPTPAGCANPQPCSEVIDAQCVIYTGDPLSCTAVVKAFSAAPEPGPEPVPKDPIVNTNDTVAEALQGIVDYICHNSPIQQCAPVVSIARNSNENILVATASGGSNNFNWSWEFASFVNGITPMFTISTQGNTSTTSTITFSNFDTSHISPFPGVGFDMYIGLAKVTATDQSTGCVVKDTYLVINTVMVV